MFKFLGPSEALGETVKVEQNSSPLWDFLRPVGKEETRRMKKLLPPAYLEATIVRADTILPQVNVDLPLGPVTLELDALEQWCEDTLKLIHEVQAVCQ